jgi:hypothetical protein
LRTMQDKGQPPLRLLFDQGFRKLQKGNREKLSLRAQPSTRFAYR